MSVLAGLFAVALATSSALADVTLVSQEARTGTGDWAIWPMNPTDPTYNWDHPTVWSTTSNFTTLDPSGDGLQLNMTRSGSTGKGIGPPAGSAHYGAWTIQDFKVVFNVDEPTPFSVESSGRWGQGIILPPVYHPGPVLWDGDGTIIFNAMRPDVPHSAMAGILQPGTYTFSGVVGAEVPREVSSLRLFESGSFTTQLIVGVPEPAVLPVVAAVGLCALRRRH
jgi:hypothetical protein